MGERKVSHVPPGTVLYYGKRVEIDPLTGLKRRARFDNRREGTRFYSAANRICQGTGGDVLKLTLVDVYAQRKALGLVLRATVHDEVVSDFPKGASLLPVVDLLNVQRVPMSVPITWKAGVGANWHEAK